MGAGFATALAEAGCYVTVVDLNEEMGEASCKGLSEKGLHAQFVKADVTSYPSLLSAFKRCLSFSPTESLDIVIPCAGLMGQPILAHLPDPSSTDCPAAPPMPVIDVNLKGVYYTTHLSLHYFRLDQIKAISSSGGNAAPPKQILFISSLLAYLEAPLVLDYNASKHAVRGIWRSLRGEGKALGIKGFRTNLIAPTLVRTPMTASFVEFLEQDRGFTVGEAKDVVNAGIRALSDKNIDGRAVAVLPDGKCVDLCDDFEGMDAGREALKLVDSGSLGSGPTKTGRFRMMD